MLKENIFWTTIEREGFGFEQVQVIPLSVLKAEIDKILSDNCQFVGMQIYSDLCLLLKSLGGQDKDEEC